MYELTEIKSIFQPYIKSEEWFKKYVDIYLFYKKQETNNPKYNFHHFVPVNYSKESLQEKNRQSVIEKHDTLYPIEHNIVKVPIQWHIIAHFCLARATEREDDINSFFTLLGEYSYPLEYYTLAKVKEFAKMAEDSALPTKQDHYMTIKELKEKNKQIREEGRKQYLEENKDKIQQIKQDSKKQYLEKNKEKLEQYKKQQKEYWKNKLKDNT